MTSGKTERFASGRLICWCIALLGLTLICVIMAKPATSQPLGQSSIAVPALTQSIAGVSLQANESHVPDMATVVFLFVGALGVSLYNGGWRMVD